VHAYYKKNNRSIPTNSRKQVNLAPHATKSSIHVESVCFFYFGFFI
jgi:hypothetical protein